jgi:hypothetical protein
LRDCIACRCTTIPPSFNAITTRSPIFIQNVYKRSVSHASSIQSLSQKETPSLNIHLHPHLISNHTQLLPPEKSICSSHLISSPACSHVPIYSLVLLFPILKPNQTQSPSYKPGTWSPYPRTQPGGLWPWKTACTRRGRLSLLCTRSRA